MQLLRLSVTVFWGLALLSPVILYQLPSILPRRRVIMFEHNGNCDEKFYPQTYANVSLTRNGSNTVVTFEAITTRDLCNPLSAEIKIIMCEDLYDRNTCKGYRNFEWKDLCNQRLITPIFKVFFDKFQPPATCPVKKGHHYCRNAQMPTDILVAFLPENRENRVLWIIRTIVWEDSQIVSCYDLSFRVSDARIRH